jgi:hypothetical protein
MKTMGHDFKKGQRIYWHDPDKGKCSGHGTIDSINGEVTLITMEAGGEFTASPWELRPAYSMEDVTKDLIVQGCTKVDLLIDTDETNFSFCNWDRAKRSWTALQAFWGSDGNEDIVAVMGDLLCDMEHLARMLGVTASEWDEIVAKSGRCNADEATGGGIL